MPPDTEVVEGELLPAVYEPPTPATLFRTSDPETALERMTEVANLLYKVVEDRRLYVTISGKKHLLVSAWTTLGGMLGLFPVVAWTRPNETGDGYVARVEVLTRDGQLVGAAEAECSRAEQRWKTRDPFALRSMASTRATSRALRGPLEQVVTLAGYEAAAAEEMPVVEADPQPSDGPLPDTAKPTAEQQAEINTLLRTLATLDPGTDWPARCVEITGTPWKLTTRGYADQLIRRLKQHADELMSEPRAAAMSEIAVELARVLIEAGETEMLSGWIEGAAWGVYEDAGRVIADPAETPEDRHRATVIRERLERMFFELRELADDQTEADS